MDRLRPLSYAQADIFFLCFSVIQPESYESVRRKWAREVEFHAPGTPTVLVGLMADLRLDESIRTRLAEKKLSPIMEEQGQVDCHYSKKPPTYKLASYLTDILILHMNSSESRSSVRGQVLH